MYGVMVENRESLSGMVMRISTLFAHCLCVCLQHCRWLTKGTDVVQSISTITS